MEIKKAFEVKIKVWKVDEINHSMSKYGDKFWVDIKGHEWGHDYIENADENGYVTVTNVWSIARETEKALLLIIDGFKCWVPKSAAIVL